MKELLEQKNMASDAEAVMAKKEDEAVRIISEEISDGMPVKNVFSYDQVNVRLPIELNDWLNVIVRNSKKFHGAKIPKEIIIEALLVYLKEKDIEWRDIRNGSDIIRVLRNQ